ncbi:MAG: hypothetical protein SRB2_01784 [Desulfobacteraceae bacterium Eth-SRB2]|nr:MAG: hypothetical protein SRB2_01784 [Desulfobacteraceae bacterium Eth-SRB2]
MIMSRPQTPKPAKLVIGFFLREKDLVVPVVKALTEKFGPVDIVSPRLPFNFTTYYEPEMGKPLFRRMLAFERLIKQSALSEIKRITNDLELAYLKNGKRMVNLDPGYLLRERFVLATGKNYSHRIYIGQRIYADLTLIYTKGRFMKLPWTYPDYAEQNMLINLERVRNKYVIDLKQTYA